MRILLVSDSDYYWGLASTVEIVSAVARANAHLLLRDGNIGCYLESADPHNVRIGRMLRAFHDVCRVSGTTSEIWS